MTDERPRQASVVPSITFLMVVIVVTFFLDLTTDLDWWARVLVAVLLAGVAGAVALLWTGRRRR
ncbi:hypothetical protein [Nocardioides gilvus]|uniref:hypothetical protein n=1 Tax=Nocardioides gilvus TaxID=1735589 RepID=UPI000D74692C|nr:hypothetical protein [Nocardioides gilvus]